MSALPGKGRVHAHHVLHEQIIRAVIGDVVEGDEQAEGREHEAHDDLGVARDQHGAPLTFLVIARLGRAIQSSRRS
jgi:hypothetical protein